MRQKLLPEKFRAVFSRRAFFFFVGPQTVPCPFLKGPNGSKYSQVQVHGPAQCRISTDPFWEGGGSSTQLEWRTWVTHYMSAGLTVMVFLVLYV